MKWSGAPPPHCASLSRLRSNVVPNSSMQLVKHFLSFFFFRRLRETTSLGLMRSFPSPKPIPLLLQFFEAVNHTFVRSGREGGGGLIESRMNWGTKKKGREKHLDSPILPVNAKPFSPHYTINPVFGFPRGGMTQENRRQRGEAKQRLGLHPQHLKQGRPSS